MTAVEPSGESIQEVLAQETARRKRVLLAFVALSLVPIAIGAYALVKAPAETSRIASDVTPIVAERVGEGIAEHVTNNVVTRTEPLIRERVTTEIASAVEPRIASAETALSSLSTQFRQTSAAIPGLQTQVASLGQTVDRTAGAFLTLQDTNDRLRQDVDAQRDVAASLTRDVAGISNRMNQELATRAQLDAVRQQNTNDLAALRTLANRGLETANANRETMTSITRRLAAIDKQLQGLDDRVARIEERLRIESDRPPR